MMRVRGGRRQKEGSWSLSGLVDQFYRNPSLTCWRLGSTVMMMRGKKMMLSLTMNYNDMHLHQYIMFTLLSALCSFMIWKHVLICLCVLFSSQVMVVSMISRVYG